MGIEQPSSTARKFLQIKGPAVLGGRWGSNRWSNRAPFVPASDRRLRGGPPHLSGRLYRGHRPCSAPGIDVDRSRRTERLVPR